MISDKQMEMIGLAGLILFFCVLLPVLFIVRRQSTRQLRRALSDHPATAPVQAALVRKRRADRLLGLCLFLAVAFVLFGMIFGTSG